MFHLSSGSNALSAVHGVSSNDIHKMGPKPFSLGWVCLLGLEVSKLELLLLVCNVGLKNRQMAVWGSATGKTNQYGTEMTAIIHFVGFFRFVHNRILQLQLLTFCRFVPMQCNDCCCLVLSLLGSCDCCCLLDILSDLVNLGSDLWVRMSVGEFSET